MSYKPAIKVSNLDKCYQLYAQPKDRLKQFLWRGKRQFFKEFWALRDINFEVMPGEVIGIIGRNGAGKSTLLQLICGTLTPSRGEAIINGRIAALLELGAGFNPEFSGRENIFMSAAIMGLSDADITERFDEIVDFSGIGEFIDQPVKTYSSGMYVRLAFSVAISVDPDILVIDEALSVGDGAFARKSFNRIMQLRDAGKTILFCSHSMYQVETICNRVLWLDNGILKKISSPADTVVAYNTFLNAESSGSNEHKTAGNSPSSNARPPQGSGIIKHIIVSADGNNGSELRLRSRSSTLEIKVDYAIDSELPPPSVAITIDNLKGDHIVSAGTTNDKEKLAISADGTGFAIVRFPNFSLLKGVYWINVFLLCEQGIHLYQDVKQVCKITVEQADLEVGIVSLPHAWFKSLSEN